MTTGTVSVLLFATAPEGSGAVTDAYHQISRSLRGTPGLVGNELLELVEAPGRFVVRSDWTDLDAFRAWERGSEHRALTAPLRPYQDRGAAAWFGVYRVAASYDGGG
jgi:heme-degrading monooxygenase HmoA